MVDLSRRNMVKPRIFAMSLIFLVFFSCFPEHILSGVVTLGSIEIYQTHEWIAPKPTVYFQCKGENKTVLPDVQKAHVLYSFKGEESWQPLTEFSSYKCKRCGFYEQDTIKSDDVFEEWEFCPSEFTEPTGKYTRFKDKEFNATFICSQCKTHSIDSKSTSDSQDEGKGMHVSLIILISALVSTVLILGLVGAFKYWQKKRRQQEQARFFKLFEDGDDMEDELGLSNIL